MRPPRTASERFCAGSIADLRERGGEVPDDLHRPYIDEVVLDCEACGGEMRRVSEVIDTWYDSGAMPFAQFHYPFENEEEFEERFPADFICEAIDQTRGWFYSLLAESTLLFDESSYRNCVCLGLILDPEGQKMSKSRGNVVEPWEVIDRHGADAFRWYYLTSQQPWAGYRFSVETVGESVRQFLLTLWNTYSFWVLYANAEGLERRRTSSRGSGAGTTQISTGGRSRGCRRPTAIVRERLDDFDSTDAGRAIADVRRRALQLVRAALAPALLGRRPRRVRDAAPLPGRDREAARALHPVHRRRDLLQPRRRRGGEFGERPDSVHLCDFPEADERSRRRARGGHGGGAARGRARPRRPRPGQGEDAPAAAQGGDRRHRGRAGRDRAPRRRSFAPSST